ncbi:MAG: amidohydrolase family protein [Rhizomicrobium sp.]
MLTLTNARLFDGRQMLPGRRSVTLDGDRITTVSEQSGIGSGERIDVGGMTLMPGLITCHLHPDFYKYKLTEVFSGIQLGKELPPGVLMAIGVRTCRVLLESGFTGYVGAACSHDIDAQLKMAIEMGIIPGPRILACSHHVGTTADANDPRKWWQRFETPGIDVFADGPDALRKLVREEIRRGAETIKFFASPGHLIPGHRGRRNMARDEIAAIVNAAHERGVLVRSHVCHKDMILECIELGVDVIDHGDEMDEECVDAMAKAGTFWVPSLTFTKLLLDLGGFDDDGEFAKSYDLLRCVLPLAQKAGVRILIGDDYSGLVSDSCKDDPLDHQVGCYGRELAFYGAIEGLSSAEVLAWGTKNAGELLVKAPGRVGVIEPGALADLIIVDGEPMADLSLLARPNEALKAVIRNGAMVIDRLPPANSRRAA